MTDYLFAHPSFSGGMARSLDLGSTLTTYNESLTENEADAIALKADWMAVGRDIMSAISRFRAIHVENKPE
jgi:hypothetical protein